MAPGASHVGMYSFQLERGPRVVIEVCRFPLIRVVTSGALRDVVRACELSAVNVVVTLFALLGRRLEVGPHQADLKVWWFMTIGTSNCPM